jgi:hypothetical protein
VGSNVTSAGKIVEVLRFIDPDNGDMPAKHVDLVDAARRLCKAPIGGQRLIDQLNQQRPVHAGMANQHDCILNMPIENEPKRIRGPGNHILQRFAVRESNQMRGGEPCGEELRLGFLDFFVAPELPSAIINVVEFVDGLGLDSACISDRIAGFDASLHGAGIDFDWPPRGRDPSRDGLSFRKSATGQRQLGTTAKAFRFDSFDMAMSD